MHTKKRDCNLAVPLVEALVLPFVPNSNTVAHAVCTNARNMRVLYYIPMGILCCNVLDYMNLPDSEKPKQSAKDAFYVFFAVFNAVGCSTPV